MRPGFHLNGGISARLLRRCAVGCLSFVQGFIESIPCKEFGVTASGNEFTSVENENLLSIADSAEAMRDDQNCFPQNKFF